MVDKWRVFEKGENVFYLNGKDQTFPYRMILKVTFLNQKDR